MTELKLPISLCPYCGTKHLNPARGKNLARTCGSKWCMIIHTRFTVRQINRNKRAALVRKYAHIQDIL